MIDPHKLHAYADGQASPDEISEIESRLGTCAASQAELEAIRSFKACVARHPYSHDHSACWKAAVGRLNEMDRAAKTERFVGRYAWAFAAGIVGLVVLTGVARRGMASPSLGSADLAQIMSQVGTGSRKTIDPRDAEIANGLLQRSRLVLGDERLRAVAMTESVIDGMLVRRLTLRDGRGQMALLDLPNEVRVEGLTPISGTMMETGQIGELQCVVWPAGSRTLVLAGERDANDLARVAERIHESR